MKYFVHFIPVCDVKVQDTEMEMYTFLCDVKVLDNGMNMYTFLCVTSQKE
jgi:hypothetical protein